MNVWQICLSIVASFGGIGLIVIAVIKFGGNIIAERLASKYELKLTKELENYKSNLDKTTHISKARFDLEFHIYGELSESLHLAVEKCYWLFPTQVDYVDETKEMYNKRLNDAIDSMIGLQSILGSKAPFITEELLNDFDKVKRMLSVQINMYPICGLLAGKRGSFDESIDKEMDKSYQRTDDIKFAHKELNAKMRSYFDSLVIVT